VKDRTIREPARDVPVIAEPDVLVVGGGPAGIAAGLGFLIGRSKGTAIVAGASAALTGAVMRQLTDVLDGDVFEF